MEKLISNELKTLDSFERDLNKSFKEIKKVFGLQKEDNNCKSRMSEYGKEPN